MPSSGKWRRLRRRVQVMLLGFFGLIPTEHSYYAIEQLPIDDVSGCKLLKVMVVGNRGVGKTCLAYRFAHGTYMENLSATIGLDFWQRVLKLEGQAIKIQVWDSAGHESPTSFPPRLFRAKQAIIVAYDITNRTSFENVPEWIEFVRETIDHETKIVVVGTKSDDENITVTTQELDELAQVMNVDVFETSAKAGYGVDDVFIRIAKIFLQKPQNSEQNQNSAPEDGTILLQREEGTDLLRREWTCFGRRRTSAASEELEEVRPLLNPDAHPTFYNGTSGKSGAQDAVASTSSGAGVSSLRARTKPEMKTLIA